VLFVQVDLILGAAEPEPHRAFGFAAINVINIQNLRPLRHEPLSYR